MERVESGELQKLGSSQSMLSKHPTLPVLMRDEAALQKEYLKKLKAKFIETSAKVRFLKFIRRDDADWGLEENERIEAQNAADKAEVRELKAKLQQSFDRATALARLVEGERRRLTQEMTEAGRFAKEVSEMRLELMRLRRDKPIEDRITTAVAEEVLDNQIVQLQDLDSELRTIQESAAASKVAVKELEEEFEALRPAVVQAKASLQAEAAASKTPGREEIVKMSKLCQWYTSAEEMYKDLVGVLDVQAPSENELRFTYDSPKGYSVSLIFNPVTRQLADAKLVGLDGVDITEILELAVAANDGRTLLWRVRMKAYFPTT